MSEQASSLKMDLARAQLKSQGETISLVTTKASIVLAACVVLASTTVNVQNVWSMGAIAAALFVLASCLSVVVIWPRDYNFGPKIEKAHQILTDYQYDDSVDWIAECCRQCAEENTPVLERNAKILHFGIFAFSFGAVLNLISLI